MVGKYLTKISFRSGENSQLVMLFRNHAINACGSGLFMNGGILISIIVFGYHYMMGREFDYSISLSAFSLMNYLSLTSIYFLYSAIITFSSFIATMFRVGEILKMDEYDDNFLWKW